MNKQMKSLTSIVSSTFTLKREGRGLFSLQRAQQTAAYALSKHQQEPKQLISIMTEAVHRFVGKAEQSDDLTMMAIQYIRPNT